MSVDQSLLVLGRYLPETILGEGAYGTVYKAVDIVSNKYVAIKYQSKVVLTEKDLYYSRREAQVLKKLDHPNIVKLIESFEDDTAFILVMEMAEGGDLLEYANQKGGFTETEARQNIRATPFSNIIHAFPRYYPPRFEAGEYFVRC